MAFRRALFRRVERERASSFSMTALVRALAFAAARRLPGAGAACVPTAIVAATAATSNAARMCVIAVLSLPPEGPTTNNCILTAGHSATSSPSAARISIGRRSRAPPPPARSPLEEPDSVPAWSGSRKLGW